VAYSNYGDLIMAHERRLLIVEDDVELQRDFKAIVETM
jgi:GR25 family glycosyltransferase involved in LPS biosynthesis